MLSILDTCTSFFMPVGGVEEEEEDNDVLYVKRNKIHYPDRCGEFMKLL